MLDTKSSNYNIFIMYSLYYMIAYSIDLIKKGT